MTFRNTKGILSNDTTAYVDADVIMTATILGFCVVRSTDQGVQFDTEGLDGRPDQGASADRDRLAAVLANVNAVLGLKLAVKQGTSPAYGFPEKVIYGVPKGDKFYPGMAVFEGLAKEIHDLALEEHGAVDASDRSQAADLGYRGKGAYAGFMVPPDGKGLAGITCTFRRAVPTDQNRWMPTEAVRLPQAGKDDLVYSIGGRDDQTAAWGLLGVNGKQQGMSTMASVPADLKPTAKDILGYTHGMVQAIVKCIMNDSRDHGAYKPFEIAVGKETTKLASCFPCTLFMCANGYPPSSIHLGRGESWVPMYPLEDGDKEFSKPADAVISATMTAWQGFCDECLLAGVKALGDAADHIAADHAPSFAALKAYISRNTQTPGWAANLVLDAVTISDTETNRLDRTLI